MSSQKPTPVLFSYKASPYAQKIHYLLTAAGIPYSDLPQPPVLPRTDLEDLGITYRRIPLLAVGRDVYADSAAIIDVILNELGGKHKIETSKADKAYELWGNDTFKTVVPLLPVQALTPQFVSDRETIFPLLAHPDRLKAQQPIALADLKSRLAWVEDVYLADRKEGASLSLADIHVIWALRWVLQDLGAATRYPGLDQTTYPRVYSLISALPKKPAGKVLNKQDAHAAILSSPASDSHSFSVAANDPLGIAQGTPVTVENADTKPGAHPQKGKLIGTSKHEIVLALETGVRLHYPRAGYLVREEGKARL